MFYGWWVVACAFAVLCLGYGIQFSFGTFLPAIEAELGWGRTRLSLPYSLYVFVYSLLSFAAGALTDRFGPRPVIAGGALFLALGFGLFSRATELWHAYLSLGAIASMGMCAVYVPCNATVVRWFARHRGLAASLANTGSSFGNLVFPPLAAALIDLHGWRTAYFELALGGALAIALISLFIVRDPEQRGLRPDGDLVPTGAPPPPPERIWTLGQARRTADFWILTAIFTCTWLVVFTPLVHLPALAGDLGLDVQTGALLLSGIGAGGIAGRLSAGPLSDRIGRRPALIGALTLQVFAFGLFASVEQRTLLLAGSVLFGMAYGGGTVLFPALVADHYGRVSAGAIVGLIFAIAGASAAFGPLFAGSLHDATGSYVSAFWISAGINGAGLALTALLPRTPRPMEAERDVALELRPAQRSVGDSR